MDTPQHGSQDRIAIARLAGTAQRHAIGRRDSYDEAAAIAELHSISADPHLLAHATMDSADWRYPAVRALLLAAGADPAVMDHEVAQMDRRIQEGDHLSQLAKQLDTRHGTNRPG